MAFVGLLALPCLFVIEVGAFLNRVVIERRKKATCKHGVAGALYKVVECQACNEEAAEDAEAKRRIAEEAAAQRERYAKEVAAKKERARLEFLSSIRLPSYLREMHPRRFELLICALFRKWGYDVEETPYAGDGGIDGHLRRGQEHLLLQCKRTKGRIGEPIVRDLYGAIHGEHASGGVLVTTGGVSDQARRWLKFKATDKPIRVIELHEIVQLIRDNFREDDVISDELLFREPRSQPQSAGSELF